MDKILVGLGYAIFSYNLKFSEKCFFCTHLILLFLNIKNSDVDLAILLGLPKRINIPIFINIIIGRPKFSAFRCGGLQSRIACAQKSISCNFIRRSSHANLHSAFAVVMKWFRKLYIHSCLNLSLLVAYTTLFIFLKIGNCIA